MKDKIHDVMSDIGDCMFNLRCQKQISVADVTVRCNCDVTNIYRIERGHNVLLGTFLKYVFALGIPVKSFDFFTNNENEYESLGSKIDQLTFNLSTTQKNMILTIIIDMIEYAQKNKNSHYCQKNHKNSCNN